MCTVHGSENFVGHSLKVKSLAISQLQIIPIDDACVMNLYQQLDLLQLNRPMDGKPFFWLRIYVASQRYILVLVSVSVSVNDTFCYILYSSFIQLKHFNGMPINKQLQLVIHRHTHVTVYSDIASVSVSAGKFSFVLGI